MNIFSPENQKERRSETFSHIRNSLRPLLDNNAESEKLVWWDQPRMNIYCTQAFFAGNHENIAFANTILRRVRDKLDIEPGPRPFEANGMAGILYHHRDKLESDVKTFIMDFFESLLPFGMTGDFQFHGYNDNMPAMWSWALTAGGELFDNYEFRDCAMSNMQQLKDMFRRRGAVSEYGSGYATHRLAPIANIAELSLDDSFRSLALELEARIWAELAGHWSTTVKQFSGPSMRGGPAYNREMPALMYQVFGHDVLPPFMNEKSYYGENRKHILDLGLDPEKFLFVYPYCYGAEFISSTYHVPENVAQLFYKKEPRYLFQCQAENGYYNPGIFCKKEPVYDKNGVMITSTLTNEEVSIPHSPSHGAQEHGLNTYHGKNYTIGTSTTNMFATSHAFSCHYQRNTLPEHINDIGVVFVRYNINNKRPCYMHKNTYWMSPDYCIEKDNYNSLYHDDGRHHCIQKDNTAMCLQVPQPFEFMQIESMRTDIFIHNPDGRIGDIYAGGRLIHDGDTLPEKEVITINEGTVYLAIHPLICRHGERKKAISFTQTEEYFVISLYNYEGNKKEMTAREAEKLGNGFVFQIDDADDFASFEAFRETMGQAKTLDKLYCGVRRVHFADEKNRISTHLCPYSNTVMFATINGLPADVPMLKFSDGIENTLPFTNGQPAPGFEDWAWIESQMNRKVEDYNPIE